MPNRILAIYLIVVSLVLIALSGFVIFTHL